MIQDKQGWINKLALGTVQFGLAYGISNKTGQVEPERVAELLEHAAAIGLTTLDTASAYGNSEEVLGTVIKTKPSRFELISKFPKETTAETFDAFLEDSIHKLAIQPLKAYLAHDFATFKRPEIRERLQRAKDAGKIDKLGVSVYYPEELEWLLERNISFDLIQCPFNLFDQRFKQIFPDLKTHQVEIHTRSSFMQGLFFMPPEELPEHFHSVKGKLEAVQSLCRSKAVPLAALLLNYSVMQEVDKVVFGVQNLDELKANIGAYEHFDTCKALEPELAAFAVADEQIIHPGKWP